MTITLDHLAQEESRCQIIFFPAGSRCQVVFFPKMMIRHRLQSRNEDRANHRAHGSAWSGVEQTTATPPKASSAWRKRRSVLRPMRGSRGSGSVTDLSAIATGMTLCGMASRIE